MGFISGMHGCFSIWKSINVIISIGWRKIKWLIDAEKSVGQNPTPIHNKNQQALRIERNFLNMIKSTYKNPVLTSSYLMIRNSGFLLRLGTKQGCLLLPSLFNIGLEVLGKAIRQEKEIRVYRFGREIVHLQMTWLHRKSERIDLKLINNYNMVVWQKIYKSLSFSYIPAMNKLNLKLKTHLHYHPQNGILKYKPDKICIKSVWGKQNSDINGEGTLDRG